MEEGTCELNGKGPAGVRGMMEKDESTEAKRTSISELTSLPKLITRTEQILYKGFELEHHKIIY